MEFTQNIINENIFVASKRMKILFFAVCFALVQALKANDILENKTQNREENDEVITKIIKSLNQLKSSKCKSDLNFTVNALHDRKSWAVASKNEFLMKCYSILHNAQ